MPWGCSWNEITKVFKRKVWKGFFLSRRKKINMSSASPGCDSVYIYTRVMQRLLSHMYVLKYTLGWAAKQTSPPIPWAYLAWSLIAEPKKLLPTRNLRLHACRIVRLMPRGYIDDDGGGLIFQQWAGGCEAMDDETVCIPPPFFWVYFFRRPRKYWDI